MTDFITPQEYKNYLAALNKQPKKKSKYLNKRVKVEEVQKDRTVKTISFDSIAERQYYYDLVARFKANEIAGFRRQVKYKLAVNGIHICSYRADFVVFDHAGGQKVIDVKSQYTRKMRMYIIKKNLMLAVHGITILEVEI